MLTKDLGYAANITPINPIVVDESIPISNLKIAEIGQQEINKILKNGEFERLLSLTLTQKDEFDRDVEWLDFGKVTNFITKNSINVISSNSGTGKTYFSTVFAIELLKQNLIRKVIHINLDGDTSVFRSRGQSETIKKFIDEKKWFHIRMQELLKNKISNPNEIIKCAISTNENLQETLIILDSLANFIPKLNETQQVTEFFNMLRTSANKGIIYIINTHNRKGEEEFSGSGMILNLADVLWSLKSKKYDDKIVFTLEYQKARYLYKNQAFELKFAGNQLFSLDFQEANMTDNQQEIVTKILNILEQNQTGINQGNLLSQLGRDKYDKTTRNLLQEHNNRYWTIEKDKTDSRVVIIKPIKLII
ncbi:ATPase domain-containing protein [Campylobacter geochelonis]|uniref:ATPase domain-containing protein n=1 Tax=Campylobacter geochelonis TaxID=1780362 RepID=UPI000770A5F6|nr:ATPase domain-containing protein [Campylobacter geochelonis]CZE50833.1 flagellar accessory protein FlaH [Campylobacter geochelonis]